MPPHGRKELLMSARQPLPRSLGKKLNVKQLPWKESGRFLWYDGKHLTLAGKGWPEESRRYERFPTRAEGKIPAKPWRQSLACAGLSLRFSSDATFFFLRTVDYDGRKNINQISMNSPSLYVRYKGRW